MGSRARHRVVISIPEGHSFRKNVTGTQSRFWPCCYCKVFLCSKYWIEHVRRGKDSFSDRVVAFLPAVLYFGSRGALRRDIRRAIIE
eukprot:184265-Rhodomonas_salina.3